MTNHYLANGDFTNIQDGIKELKSRNKNIDFNILSACDLAGKNLKREIIDCDKINLVQTDELENLNTKISITATYKFGFPESIWADKEQNQIQIKIQEKILRFLKSWEETDPFKTEIFLRENILNIAFWEKELRVILIQQDITVKNRIY